MRKRNSNFPKDFIIDFELGPKFTKENHTSKYYWEFSEKAKQRFHLPITYIDTDGEEGSEHYSKKQQIHDYIYENHYINGDCKFYVTTELKQLHAPFKALMAENPHEDKVLYKLDVCAIRVKDNQVFDIEIDGPEHTTYHRMMTDTMRDRLLNHRYGIYTLRIDRDEHSINFKKLDEFLNKNAMEYVRVRE